MEFWRVELLLQNYQEFVEEENKQNSGQKAEQEKMYQHSTPQMPKFEMPKFEMPKFNIGNL